MVGGDEDICSPRWDVNRNRLGMVLRLELMLEDINRLTDSPQDTAAAEFCQPVDQQR
jgi:hypothetical protein